MKFNKIFVIISVSIFVLVFLFIVFSHIIYKHKKRMLAELDVILEQLLTEARTINSVYDYHLNQIDSICNKGNQLIKMSNLSEQHAAYINFNHFFGENQFEIVDEIKNDIIIQTKLIQIFAIEKELLYLYHSHFQSELIGVMPLTQTIKCNKKELIQLFPFTMSREIKPPIVIINNDTLPRDEDFYELSVKKTIPGTYLFNGEIIIERWGKTDSYPIGFYLNAIK